MKFIFPPDRKDVIVIRPKMFKLVSDLRAGISTKCLDKDPIHSINADNESKGDYSYTGIALSKLGIIERWLAVPNQCHSNNVIKVDTPGEYKNCDALITNVRYIALTVKVADCVPILIYDPVNNAIAAVHAGWRGTVKEIVKHAVEEMKKEYRTQCDRLLVYIGPSAGVCCYEAGKDVAVLFRNKIVSYSGEKINIDLKEENNLQLQDIGVPAVNIEVSRHCTICGSNLFHSFRHDGVKAGRMIAAICLIS